MKKKTEPKPRPSVAAKKATAKASTKTRPQPKKRTSAKKTPKKVAAKKAAPKPAAKKAPPKKTAARKAAPKATAKKAQPKPKKKAAARKTAAMALTAVGAKAAEASKAGAIPDLLMGLFSKMPESREEGGEFPMDRAQAVARVAALKAASASGALALPPGPFALATILPDLAAVWYIQGQMVADIAAVYGKTSKLTKETMFFCLFKHGAAALMKDVSARTGERLLIKYLPAKALRELLNRVGIRVTQKTVAKSISRVVPFVGALAVGGYAYYDTMHVAATAIEAFSGEIEVEAADPKG